MLWSGPEALRPKVKEVVAYQQMESSGLFEAFGNISQVS